MKKQYLAYRPMLNAISGKRELVYAKTMPYGNTSILHSDDEEQTVKWTDGSVEYYKNGLLHNENGPAIISINKDHTKKTWYDNGKIHRIGAPAIEVWWGTNNELVYQEYYVENIRHREDGPAIIHPSGTEIYYIDGKLYNKNGPAIINKKDGKIIGQQWFISNKDVTKSYKRWSKKHNTDPDSENFKFFCFEYLLSNGVIK